MAFGENIQSSMAAGFARAGIGDESSNIISSLGQLEQAQRMAAAREYAAELDYLARTQGRAEGGPVEKDQPYVVGEKGPEVIVPKTDGTVIPNRNLQDLGGGLQATTGSGTYNRPAARQVVPKSLDLSSLAPETRAAMESGQWVHQPVQVIRGRRVTYAGGPAGQEWRSLDKAARAGRGEYMPTIAEEQHQRRLEEIQATGKAMEAQGGLAARALEGATGYLTKMLLQGYGVPDPADKTGQTKVLPDYAQGAMLKFLPNIKNIEDVPKILEQMRPELEAGRQIAILDTEANRAKMLANVRAYRQSQALPPDSATEQFILSGKITPANYKGYLGWLNFGAPKQPSLKDAATAKPAATKPWTPNSPNPWPGILKKAASYGQKDWEPEPLPFRAEGGPVEKDQPYVVGEKGPEVFVPETKGAGLPDLSTLAPVKQTEYDEVSLGGKG